MFKFGGIKWQRTKIFFKNFLEGGKMTEGITVYNDKLERFDGINNNNMKRYFNSNFEYGSINITDYRLLSSEYHIEQRSKYINNITSVLAFK